MKIKKSMREELYEIMSGQSEDFIKKTLTENEDGITDFFKSILQLIDGSKENKDEIINSLEYIISSRTQVDIENMDSIDKTILYAITTFFPHVTEDVNEQFNEYQNNRSK